MIDLKEAVSEASKCQFCGFREFTCPTFRAIRIMHFGPRGRINIVKNFSREMSEEAYGGVMRCLLCGSCEPECAAGIKITEAIRALKMHLAQTR